MALVFLKKESTFIFWSKKNDT